MSIRSLLISCVFTIAVCGAARPAAAQSQAQSQDLPRWARVSFFGQSASMSPVGGGDSTSFNELSTSVQAESGHYVNGGFEYGLNIHFSTYPSSQGRTQRSSVYDAYVALGLMGGALFVKGGQMWLTDFAGLGSVTGGLVEYRQSRSKPGLKLRVGGFAGLEPKPLDFGDVSGITKYGVYAALDGNGAQKHVVGYVLIRNQGMTERSVLTITNFLPAGHQFFLYQAAEITLSGAGGQAGSNLAYFFVNAHEAPSRLLDLQFTYHRGQSIDYRSITDDILAGRPVPAKSLDGYLFESIGGRVTVEVVRNVRAFFGYAQDKNGFSTGAANRISFGVSSANLLNTGIDVNVSDYRYSNGSGPTYDSWYVSVGRNISPSVYVSAEYTTSLSVIRFLQSSGLIIETRPKTKRWGGSAVVHLARAWSMLFNFDHTQDTSYNENRFLAGLTFRF